MRQPANSPSLQFKPFVFCPRKVTKTKQDPKKYVSVDSSSPWPTPASGKLRQISGKRSSLRPSAMGSKAPALGEASEVFDGDPMEPSSALHPVRLQRAMHLVVVLKSFVSKRPFFANKKVTFANLSRIHRRALFLAQVRKLLILSASVVREIRFPNSRCKVATFITGVVHDMHGLERRSFS